MNLPPASPFALLPPDGSIRRLRRALDLDPGNRELRLTVGRAMAGQGRFEEARLQAELMLAGDAGDEEARYLLAWGALGAGEDGVPGLLRGLAREAAFCQDLAVLASNLGHWETTCALIARALELEPDAFAIQLKYALALDYAGHFQETLRLLEAMAIRFSGEPELLAQIRFHQANSRLLLGDLAEGFRLMEVRLAMKPPGKALPLRRWQGEDLAGRKLLLRAEQGFGDVFMFVRYAALLAAQGAEVYVDPFFSTERVLATCPGLMGVLHGKVALPATMLQVELLSLPHLCGTEAGSIPAAIPYLAVPEVVTNREALAAAIQGPGRRLGLVWSGNPNHRRRHERDLPAEILDLLAEVPGVTWFSLQKGEVPHPQLPLVDLAPLLEDFSATAFALSRLDGLISVDTGVVHLAGAMGLPVWVLVSHLPDWRWMLERSDSPWYPTVRVWRQATHWDWAEVVARVAAELTQAPPGSGGCRLQVP